MTTLSDCDDITDLTVLGYLELRSLNPDTDLGTLLSPHPDPGFPEYGFGSRPRFFDKKYLYNFNRI